MSSLFLVVVSSAWEAWFTIPYSNTRDYNIIYMDRVRCRDLHSCPRNRHVILQKFKFRRCALIRIKPAGLKLVVCHLCSLRCLWVIIVCCWCTCLFSLAVFVIPLHLNPTSDYFTEKYKYVDSETVCIKYMNICMLVLVGLHQESILANVFLISNYWLVPQSRSKLSGPI